jgi:hypothetical protein
LLDGLDRLDMSTGIRHQARSSGLRVVDVTVSGGNAAFTSS